MCITCSYMCSKMCSITHSIQCEISFCVQVIESTGVVVTPYMEYPQLLGMLLHMLSEGSPQARLHVLKVLGIVGALDPHTHKVNQANIQGEGKLEREGVRPQRQHDPTGGLGAPHGAATTLGKLSFTMHASANRAPKRGLCNSPSACHKTLDHKPPFSFLDQWS